MPDELAEAAAAAASALEGAESSGGRRKGEVNEDGATATAGEAVDGCRVWEAAAWDADFSSG